MKAIIPVAGFGTRLRPHTHTQPKALIPVAGKAILAHIIDELKEAGYQDFVFVIGYLGEKIEEYVRGQYPGLRAEFVVQHQREGIAHAIWIAREFLKGEDTLMIALGDTIFDMDMADFNAQKGSVLGVKRVEDPRRFGVAETNADGSILKLVEKPQEPKSNLALVGIYKIENADKLMAAIQHLIDHDIRTKNEFQLTDALQHLIEQGEKFTPYAIENWYDCGKRDALLETNAILLRRAEFSSSHATEHDNTIIIQPVKMAEGVQVRNSIIGPNVSIGPRAAIDSCIIRDSIVGTDATIRNAVLHDSLIGTEAVLIGPSQSLNLGDSTEISYQ